MAFDPRIYANFYINKAYPGTEDIVVAKTQNYNGLSEASYCPPGSISINEYSSLIFLVATMMIILLVFRVQKKIESLKAAKYQKLSVDQRLTQGMELNSLSKTFDIEFTNLGLNGIEIIGGITGSLQHGRTCAIMGPSGVGKTTLIALLAGKAKRSNGIIKGKKIITSSQLILDRNN
ncbi:20573_t:CDS:2 [Entrophospora sp. SA101]|nr:20573_t:CDS:2 [Entrophospora sp. SA101]